jgi:hypothetical protein
MENLVRLSNTAEGNSKSPPAYMFFILGMDIFNALINKVCG